MTGGNRNPASQGKHDRQVSETAQKYKGKGYAVAADVTGYPKPGTTGGYRPDLVVTKKGHTTIIEVETPESLNTPHANAQDSAFRQARRRRSNLHYKKITTD